jgi:transcriptional regulator with XRE-family HTH domain
MKTRIRRFIDYKSISPVELADQIGVQRSNISHILNGRNKPGAAFLEKFLFTFPEVNARWLLTGEGDMLSGGTKAESIPDDRQDSGHDIPDTPDLSREETAPQGARQASATGQDESFNREEDGAPGGRAEEHDQRPLQGGPVQGEFDYRRPAPGGDPETSRHQKEMFAERPGDVPAAAGEVRSEPDVPYGKGSVAGFPGYKSKDKSIDKVILLYTDGTFVSYQQE